MDDLPSDTSFDAERAAVYDRRIRRLAPGYDALHAMVVSLLSTLLDEDAHVLVVGAGTGAEILRLGRTHPDWRFTAVDPSRPMLDRCREALAGTNVESRVEYICARIEEVNVEGHFDAATAIFVAHFIRDTTAKQQFFQAIAHLLRPQAPFIVADLYRVEPDDTFDTLTTAWRTLLKHNGVSEQEVERTFARIEESISFVEESALERILRGAGFGRLARFYQALLWGAWWTRKR